MVVTSNMQSGGVHCCKHDTALTLGMCNESRRMHWNYSHCVNNKTFIPSFLGSI